MRNTTLYAFAAILLSASSAAALSQSTAETVRTNEGVLAAESHDALSRTCYKSGIYAVTGSCSHGPYYVTDDALATTFTLPFLGYGSSHLNLQERTPVVGDYVTFYDRTCASPLPATGSNSYQCFGGQVRSWHYNEYHRFFGEHQWTCLSALHCFAEVKATYS